MTYFSRVRILRIIIFVLVIIVCILFIGINNPYEYPKNTFTKKVESSDTRKIYEKCKNFQAWRECYGTEFAEIVGLVDVSYAQKTLIQLQKLDKKTADCHIIAHRIMEAAAKKVIGDWRRYISEVNPSQCNYGFVHGLLEGASEFDSSFQLNEQSINEICSLMKKENDNQNTDQGCAHAMGHLLLAETCGEVNDGLAICKKLKASLQYQCFGGVLMENFTQDNVFSHCGIKKVSFREKLEEQERICNSLSGEEGKACWMEISHLYSDSFGDSPEILYKSCERASNYENTIACFIHITASLAIEKVDEKKYHTNVCSPIIKDKKNYDKCIRAVAATLLGGSILNVGDSVSFCNSIPEVFMSSCFLHIKNFAKSLNFNDRKKICSSLPAKYREECQ